jgi:AcrR family transcriptional regulator
MDKTLELLKDASYKDLAVADVAFEAGVSKASFYVYFSDIEDILFACVQDAAQDMNSILEVLNDDWNRKNLKSKVREFVEGYMKLWEKHTVELRIRNLEADQGNLRFLQFRLESTKDVLDGLASKIAELQPDVNNAHALAAVIFTSMERLAAISHKSHHSMGRSSRLTPRKLNEAIVDLLLTLLVKGPVV